MPTAILERGTIPKPASSSSLLPADFQLINQLQAANLDPIIARYCPEQALVFGAIKAQGRLGTQKLDIRSCGSDAYPSQRIYADAILTSLLRESGFLENESALDDLLERDKFKKRGFNKERYRGATLVDIPHPALPFYARVSSCDRPDILGFKICRIVITNALQP